MLTHTNTLGLNPTYIPCRVAHATTELTGLPAMATTLTSLVSVGLAYRNERNR